MQTFSPQTCVQLKIRTFGQQRVDFDAIRADFDCRADERMILRRVGGTDSRGASRNARNSLINGRANGAERRAKQVGQKLGHFADRRLPPRSICALKICI